MKEKKIGIIIQARMGSTRLPGKVLEVLYNNERVLDVLLKRLKFCKEVDEIIVATTPDKKNQAIINVAKEHGISWFIGDEENVLKRYYDTAKNFNLDIVIRITSDCPFVDPKILDDMILYYHNNSFDYVRNVDETTNLCRGFEIEIFRFQVLEKVFNLAKTKPEKEHVTYYIYTHPEDFSINTFKIENLKSFKNLRLTIDEKYDLIACQEVMKKVMEKNRNFEFTIFDIYEVIEENPYIMDINKNVIHKKVKSN